MTAIVTEGDIVGGLRAAGVHEGDTVLVHVSLSALGFVVGGEQTVIAALRRVLGQAGTAVMPAQSWHLCDPDYLADPRWSPEERQRIRDALPAYDVIVTPTRMMGAVAELFRRLPSARRSPHPHRSFAAAGRHAEAVVAAQALADPFGESSPLAVLYGLEAKVVLLGVGYDKCTALHLAEGRAGLVRGTASNGAPMMVEGRREWVAWEEVSVEDDDFAQLGGALDEALGVMVRRIGDAPTRVIAMVDLVDFAARWMKARRSH